MTVSFAQVGQMLFFAVPSILLFYLAARDVRKAYCMRRWPRVDGTVIASRTRGGTRNTAKLDVQVEFTFRDKTLRIWCKSPTGAGYTTRQAGDDDALQNKIASIQAGDRMMAIVNPAKPSEAYLRMPEPILIIGMILGGLLFAAMAVSMLFLAT